MRDLGYLPTTIRAADPDTYPSTRAPGVPGDDDLRALADALAWLLARDGDDPPLWWSPTFARQVASARSVVATVTSTTRLSAGLERPGPSGTGVRGRFDADARRLARDPVSVALAVRWLELRDGAMLPTWTELLRRRSLSPCAPDRGPEPTPWFG